MLKIFVVTFRKSGIEYEKIKIEFIQIYKNFRSSKTYCSFRTFRYEVKDRRMRKIVKSKIIRVLCRYPLSYKLYAKLCTRFSE